MTMDKEDSSSNKAVVSSESAVSEAEKKSSFRSTILGYTFAFLVIVTYTIAVVSAQLSVSSTSLFQRSLMRYVSQIVITLATVVICRSGVKIQMKHIYMIFIIAVFDFGYNYSFYLAAAYLPVGNMEGIFTSLIIVLLGFYDILRKKCKSHQVIAGLVCSLGLLLLLQPWEIQKELNNITQVTSTSPCELFGSVNVNEDDTMTDRRLTTADVTLGESLNMSTTQTNTLVTNLLLMTETTSNQDMVNVSMYDYTTPTNSTDGIVDTFINDIWVGYVLIVSATVCMSIISIFIGKLTADLQYHPAVVSYWAALVNAVVSMVLMLTLEEPRLPSGTYCILFSFVLAVLSASNSFFSHITLKYLLPSQTALVLSLSMVVLFICQNTSLPGVQPGRGNAAEIAGAVVTFVGAVSSPLYQVFRRPECKHVKAYDVSFHNEAMEEEDAHGVQKGGLGKENVIRVQDGGMQEDTCGEKTTGSV